MEERAAGSEEGVHQGPGRAQVARPGGRVVGVSKQGAEGVGSAERPFGAISCSMVVPSLCGTRGRRPHENLTPAEPRRS